MSIHTHLISVAVAYLLKSLYIAQHTGHNSDPNTSTKMASLGLIIFGSLNFQKDNIAFEYYQQDLDLYESFVNQSVEAIGSDYVWYNSTRNELNKKLAEVPDFTDILFIGHTFEQCMIIKDGVELLFYDEILLQTVQSKNMRIFIYTCFNDSIIPLPSSFVHIKSISDIYNHIRISVDVSGMNRIDELIVNVCVKSYIESFTAASVHSMYFEKSGITLRAGRNSLLLSYFSLTFNYIYTMYYIILVHYIHV